jgi:hypothetical protein
MRLSRRGIQEFLHDWFDLGLSTSTIHRCLHEAGRAVEPLEQTVVEEVQQAALAYADETPWKEWGHLLWLWVITTPTLSLYLIGYRTAELIENALGIDFSGWLMSDGYRVYRRFHQRLRCWAHLLRKAQGLKDSLTREASTFGAAALGPAGRCHGRRLCGARRAAGRVADRPVPCAAGCLSDLMRTPSVFPAREDPCLGG